LTAASKDHLTRARSSSTTVRNLREWHLKEFEMSVGPAADRDPDEDVSGYG